MKGEKVNKKYTIEVLLVSLEKAVECAVEAGFDHHYVSELRHLISTAEANREVAEKE